MSPTPQQPAPSGRWLTRRRLLQLLLGLVLSSFFLWLTLRQVDLAEAWAVLRTARWWFLVPAVVTYFIDLGVRAWRWTVLLRPVGRFPWRRLYSVMSIGYMGNILLPARLGELLRAGVLGRRAGISATLGSIATERVLDGLTTVALILITSQFLPRPEWLSLALTSVAVVFVGALIGLALALAFRPTMMSLLWRVFGRFTWARRPLGWAERFLDGLGALRDPALLARAVGIGLIAWTFSALQYAWVFLAFDLHLGVAAAYFAVAAVGLSTAIPSAPGYVGTFEFAGVTVLTALGAAPADAFSAVIVIHLLQIIPITAVGLFFTWREGLSITRAASASLVQPPPEAGA